MGLRERRRKERIEKRKKKVWYWFVMGTLLLIVVGCVVYLLGYKRNLNQNEDAYENMRSTEAQEPTEEAIIIEEIETETESEPEVPTCEKVYDFEELQETNQDIYAWITVPGTLVDYPVLQSEKENYYLNRNLDGSEGYPGCIFTNDCNTKDFSDYNTVLYGHNMKNDSMFGSLHDFESEDFFEENRQIIVYTRGKRFTYEIYAAVKFSDAYIPAYYSVKTVEGTEDFLEELHEMAEGSSVSHIKEDMEVTAEDKFITLSTCVAGEKTRRYIIVGCLVEEAYVLGEEAYWDIEDTGDTGDTGDTEERVIYKTEI